MASVPCANHAQQKCTDSLGPVCGQFWESFLLSKNHGSKQANRSQAVKPLAGHPGTLNGNKMACWESSGGLRRGSRSYRGAPPGSLRRPLRMPTPKTHPQREGLGRPAEGVAKLTLWGQTPVVGRPNQSPHMLTGLEVSVKRPKPGPRLNLHTSWIMHKQIYRFSRGVTTQ